MSSTLNYDSKKLIVSEIINSLIVLFIPNSRILFEDFIAKHKIKTDELSLEHHYFPEMMKLYSKFKSFPGNNFIQKIFYSIGPVSYISYFEIKVDNPGESELERINNEPDLIITPDTILFGFEYKFSNNLLKNITILDTFGNFKLNSIYAIIDKPISFIKYQNIWYLFDERFGYIIIPTTVVNQTIVFEPLKIGNLIFSMNLIKECVFFYLKENKLSNKLSSLVFTKNPTIKDYSVLNTECDCTKNIGWKQLSGQFCKSAGVCWFDASMMALLIPLKLRKIFLDKVHKKFDIPKDKLFPCYENYNEKNKGKFIKKLTNVDIDKDLSTIFKMPLIFFSALDHLDKIPFYLTKSKNEFMKIFVNPNYFVNDPKYKYSYKILNENQLNLSYKFFMIHSNSYFEYPKEKISNFSLQSITFATFIDDDIKQPHLTAFIKCKQGWFLYDNVLAMLNKNMIPLNVLSKNGYLIFKQSNYTMEFSNKTISKMNGDLSKSYERIYYYAK